MGDDGRKRRETTAIVDAEMDISRRVLPSAKSLRLSFMVTHDRQTAGVPAPGLSDGFCYLLHCDPAVRCLNPPLLSFPMGRPSWATAEQLVFLRSYLHELPRARAGTGLNVLYKHIAQDFLVRWEPEPVAPQFAPSKATASELKDLAKVQLYDVSFVLTCAYSTVNGQYQRVMYWYKEFLKASSKKSSQGPYEKQRPLDLTGRSARKKPPYQLHQAYSVVHWRPMGSPLRHEVNDLWIKRQDDVVSKPSNPFIKEGADIISLTRLQFHMAVMRWKCSSLSPEELATLFDWIDKKRALNDCPWAVEAETYGDDLVAENRHIQGSVICPLST